MIPSDLSEVTNHVLLFLIQDILFFYLNLKTDIEHKLGSSQ